MAKAPWEATAADPDLEAFASGMRNGGGPKRLGRFLAWVLGILILTVLLGYYLPLSQAHGVLIEQHRTLAGKAKALEQSVIEANTALRTAELRRDELEAGEKQKETRSAALRQRSETVRNALAALIQKHAKKGTSAVGTTSSGVVVALPDAVVFAPRKLDVTADGQDLLCEIQKASAGRALTVSAVVDPKANIPQLKGRYPEIWGLSAARAASAAAVLESQCGVPRARLRALAAPVSKASFDGVKPAPAHVAIEIDFSESN